MSKASLNGCKSRVGMGDEEGGDSELEQWELASEVDIKQ